MQYHNKQRLNMALPSKDLLIKAPPLVMSLVVITFLKAPLSVERLTQDFISNRALV